jgi:hypothetical protein
MRKEYGANVRGTYADILEVHLCRKGVEAGSKCELRSDY